MRWSIMGPHMTYHLGGGEGGIAHYLDHLGPRQERRWASLGSPKLTEDVKAAIVAGVEARVDRPLDRRARSAEGSAAGRDPAPQEQGSIVTRPVIVTAAPGTARDG